MSICFPNLAMVQERKVVVEPNCFDSDASFTVGKCNVLKFQSSFSRSRNLFHICEACIDYLEVKLFKITSNVEGSRDIETQTDQQVVCQSRLLLAKHIQI